MFEVHLSIYSIFKYDIETYFCSFVLSQITELFKEDILLRFTGLDSENSSNLCIHVHFFNCNSVVNIHLCISQTKSVFSFRTD